MTVISITGNDVEPLTAKQKQAYLRHKGCQCPCCGSRDIEGTGEHETDGDWHSEEVQCNSCKAVWNDLYILKDVELVEAGRDEVRKREGKH